MHWDSNNFWEFSCKRYARNALAAELIWLQDTFGANVNLALLCQFVDEQGLSLTASQLETLMGTIALSDKELTQFRAKRRQAKGRADYDRLLAYELELEKQQQALLIATLKEMNVAAATVSAVQNYLTPFTTNVSEADLARINVVRRVLTQTEDEFRG